jgi:predicted dinucleotide-binding enzyme
MRIAFIGTGNVTNALATPLAHAGYTIVLGSRDPASKKAEFPFPVLSHAKAVTDAEVVVNATTGRTSLDVFTAIGDAALAGKVLLDLGNATTPEWELVYPNSSLGQALQVALPSARVVKTANTAYIGVIADPARLGEKGTLFISGDDDTAKAVVRQLRRELGWNDESVLDLGGIETARNAEHYFLLFYNIIRATGNPTFNIKVVH